MLKVSELIGAQLDYWVARAEGVPAEQLEIRQIQRSSPPEFHCVRVWNHHDFIIGPDILALPYSTSWHHAGPIIEAEKILLLYYGSGQFSIGAPSPWEAQIGSDTHYVDQYPGDAVGGPTPLVAAMRAYVFAKFGEEVPECGN